jgi:hypothetical protein
MTVLTVYRSLSAEQKQILRDKKVDLNRPIDEILALLRPIAACDKVAEWPTSRARRWAVRSESASC